MSNKMLVREATIEDSSIILKFIKEHAIEESLKDKVVATQENIEKHIFREKIANVLLIENEDHAIVGYAIYFYALSSFSANKVLYLEDLYVIKGYRRNGFGKALMVYLLKLTLSTGCERMQWLCPNDNKSAMAFYKTWGSKFFDGYSICRVEHETLEEFANYK